LLGYFEWFTVGGEYAVPLGISGSDYTVDSFGGNYTVALYAWGDNYATVTLLSTSATIFIPGSSSMAVTVQGYDMGEDLQQLVTGAWEFEGAQEGCLAGDVVVVVPVDQRGESERLSCDVM